MYIYKITNVINNKCYIGQTAKSIDIRWKRHINDAMSNRLDTHLARAIRKYGSDNFIIEKIDTANTQEELTQKECYWIKELNTCEDGYNETDSPYKSGGNTYKHKNIEEMQAIKNKIKETKIGGNNPHSTSIKCKNIKTLQELYFESMQEVADFFGEKNHSFVSRRVRKIIKKIYKDEWIFAYKEEDYPDYVFVPYNYKAKKIEITVLENSEKFIFENFASAERYFDFPKQSISKTYNRKKAKKFLFRKKYKITILN
jgi:group I intron endonuclease